MYMIYSILWSDHLTFREVFFFLYIKTRQILEKKLIDLEKNKNLTAVFNEKCLVAFEESISGLGEI